MKKKIFKIIILTGIGIICGALLGYAGQCAGST